MASSRSGSIPGLLSAFQIRGQESPDDLRTLPVDKLEATGGIDGVIVDLAVQATAVFTRAVLSLPGCNGELKRVVDEYGAHGDGSREAHNEIHQILGQRSPVE
ncbi:hypothetical protein PG985_005276 [Apiospora marii]|uniref:Uncharacterized protein n=1 Tax=Apiospora marii TaxID=335849 RepID=A0ABR1SBL8_9PEZI